MRILVLQGGNYIFLVALFLMVALLELFLAGTGFGSLEWAGSGRAL